MKKTVEHELFIEYSGFSSITELYSFVMDTSNNDPAIFPLENSSATHELYYCDECRIIVVLVPIEFSRKCSNRDSRRELQKHILCPKCKNDGYWLYLHPMNIGIYRSDSQWLIYAPESPKRVFVAKEDDFMIHVLATELLALEDKP